MARDIEEINITLPGESDTIILNVNGEPSEVMLSLDSWPGADDELDLTSRNAVQNRIVTAALNGKQGTLTAGTNITIDSNNVISASGGGGGGAVDSVNGKTGVVVLDADDVGALPDNTTYVASFNGNTGAVTYSAPVSSVNGQTGAVTISVPTKTSDLNNDSGFITDAGVTSFNGSTGAVTYTAPVTSVNGSTGAVTVTVPTQTSDLNNDSGYITGVAWGDITGTLSSQTDLQTALDAKQGKLTAGANITIDQDNVISSTGGGGGSAHTIIDSDGNAMTQRGKLKFSGATVTDDGVTDTTIVSGLKGDKGDQGDAGSAATIAVGTVTSGASASVTNSGTSTAAVFDFVLPKGDTGATGPQGPQGETGAQGAKGDTGDTGPQGPKGDTGDTGATGPAGSAATIAVGTVTSGASASVTNSGTSSAAVFDFVLPKGDTGDTGPSGSAATIAVGNVSSGASASVTNTGTNTAAVFDFVLPKGDKGDTGDTGATGPQGPKGDTGDTGATGPQGPQGDTGATGNGISSIAKTGTAGLVDTYTITYTDSTTSTYTVTNGADGQDLAASTVATIEASSTASANYAEGEYLVYNGILYKVIAAITAGETLTVGTNIQATTAGAELTALNDDLTTTETTMTITLNGVSATLYLIKSGNAVQATCYLGNGSSFTGFSGSETVGTVPAGFLPRSDMLSTCVARTEGAWAASSYYPVAFIISTAGAITIRGNSTNISNCKYIILGGSYIVQN